MLIGYSRCSTKEQDHGLQLDALNLAHCERIFSDTASGGKTDRVELAKALQFCHDGDVLVVWRLDRLARSVHHLCEIVADLQKRGVGLRSLNEDINTTTPSGRLIFHVFAALAEFERALIRERVTAGIKAAQDRGVKFGRPQVVTPEIVAQAKASGKSVREAAKELGISKSALYAAL